MMALEAIACGTPVLAFADTALADLLDETGGGLTVPWRDTAALADALGRLIADPARRADLAAAGRAAVVRDYTLDRYVRAARRALRGADRSGSAMRVLILGAGGMLGHKLVQAFGGASRPGRRSARRRAALRALRAAADPSG